MFPLILNILSGQSYDDQRCEFYGSKGEIINKQFKQNAKLSFSQGYAKAFEGVIKEFHKCMQNNIPPLVTDEECLNNYTIANVCKEGLNKHTHKKKKNYKGWGWTWKLRFCNSKCCG